MPNTITRRATYVIETCHGKEYSVVLVFAPQSANELLRSFPNAQFIPDSQSWRFRTVGARYAERLADEIADVLNTNGYQEL